MTGMYSRAKHLLLHPEELRKVLREALVKLYAQRRTLVRVLGEFLLLFRLLRAWLKGEYREVPRKTILWAVLAVLYFLSPIDLIPDFLPAGYLDDIAVIAFVVRKTQEDLDRFKAWENKRKGA